MATEYDSGRDQQGRVRGVRVHRARPWQPGLHGAVYGVASPCRRGVGGGPQRWPWCLHVVPVDPMGG